MWLPAGWNYVIYTENASGQYEVGTYGTTSEGTTIPIHWGEYLQFTSAVEGNKFYVPISGNNSYDLYYDIVPTKQEAIIDVSLSGGEYYRVQNYGSENLKLQSAGENRFDVTVLSSDNQISKEQTSASCGEIAISQGESAIVSCASNGDSTGADSCSLRVIHPFMNTIQTSEIYCPKGIDVDRVRKQAVAKDKMYILNNQDDKEYRFFPSPGFYYDYVDYNGAEIAGAGSVAVLPDLKPGYIRHLIPKPITEFDTNSFLTYTYVNGSDTWEEQSSQELLTHHFVRIANLGYELTNTGTNDVQLYVRSGENPELLKPFSYVYYAASGNPTFEQGVTTLPVLQAGCRIVIITTSENILDVYYLPDTGIQFTENVNASFMTGKGINLCIDGDIAGITNPVNNGNDQLRPWFGSKVYFGKYNNTDLLFRVLDAKTTDYSTSGFTMFLDCDNIVEKMFFDAPATANDNPSNVWSNSYVRTWLNGIESQKYANNNFRLSWDDTVYNLDGFLYGFSDIEREAIIESKRTEPAGLGDGCIRQNLSWVPLNGDKVFMLDAKEATNPLFGYGNMPCMFESSEDAVVYSRIKQYNGQAASWFLRSGHPNPWYYQVGLIDGSGAMSHEYNINDLDTQNGVSPAMNLDLSKVLFSTAVNENKVPMDKTGALAAVNTAATNTWKLTLLDSTLSVTPQSALKDAEGNVTVQYACADTSGRKGVQISVMITDKPYTSTLAEVLYYGKLQDVTGSANTGYTGSFQLPASLPEGHQVYLIQEQMNVSDENADGVPDEVTSDYASTPVSLSITLTSVEITGLDLPEGTKKFDMQAASSTTRVENVLAVQWKDSTEKVMTSDDVAAFDTLYKAEVTLASSPGYQFPKNVADITIRVNEQEVGADKKVLDENGNLKITLEYTTDKVAAPVVTLTSEEAKKDPNLIAFEANQPFTLESTTTDVKIYYTLDGTKVYTEVGGLNESAKEYSTGDVLVGIAGQKTTITLQAVAAAGTVTYLYSTALAGTYADVVPTEAGTYYVKAQVAGTETIQPLESASVSFTIQKAAQDVPTGLGQTPESIYGKADGTITGLADNMEIRPLNQTSDETIENETTGSGTAENETTGSGTSVNETTGSGAAENETTESGSTADVPTGSEVVETDTGYTSVAQYSGAAYDSTAKTLTDLKSGTYEVRYAADINHNASPAVKVTVAEGKKLTVTLPASAEQVGYTLIADATEVAWNGSVTLTFKLKEGYTLPTTDYIFINKTATESGEAVKVTVDGTAVIDNIQKAITVTVEGIADQTAPEGSITLGEYVWNDYTSGAAFELYFRTAQSLTVKAADIGSGLKDIAYCISQQAYTLSDMQTVELDWKALTVENATITLAVNTKSIVYVKLTDNDGNSRYLRTTGIVVDETVPGIKGLKADGVTEIQEGAVYCETLTMSVEEIEGIANVTVNGVEVAIDAAGKFTLTEATGTSENLKTIVATDKAGNLSLIHI